MSRKVQVVLLCEDRQQETFLRRFLERMGSKTHILRVVKAPQGRGAGEQFVREMFPVELQGQRCRHVGQALVVMIDGDSEGMTARLRRLDEVCKAQEVAGRTDGEPVAVFVPTRNIETWLAYLDGQTVDERHSYPRLGREGECQRHVDALVKMCRQGQLRQPAPPSLEAACQEYGRLRAVTR